MTKVTAAKIHVANRDGSTDGQCLSWSGVSSPPRPAGSRQPLDAALSLGPMRSGCPICRRGRPLDVLVDLPATWVTAARDAPLPGYVCIVSKVHVTEPFELRGPARSSFWDEVSGVAEAVQASTGSPKLNYEIHGNTVPHLHIHLYPRYPGDPFEGGPIDPRANQPFVRSEPELAALREAITAALGRAPSK
jgi:diadenosine tetraphosphate (Ap4A) HIT family hydrolase